MMRRHVRGLLLGASLIALALARPAAAQDLVNPSGTTVLPGFIKVDPGETFDNVFNFGTVQGDGALGAGIEVEGTGAVLGDVVNAATGIISLTGEAGTGILVSHAGASIGDDIENFGLIEIDAREEGYGILVDGTNTTVGGDIANRTGGVMHVLIHNTDTVTGLPSALESVSGASAYGIYVVNSVTGIDAVANLGELQVEAVASARADAVDDDFAFAVASVTDKAIAYGIYVASPVGGGVINADELEVDAVARASALAVATGFGVGAAIGGGVIQLTARAVGMAVVGGSVGGSIENSGAIDVAATAAFVNHATAYAVTGDASALFLVGAAIARSVNAIATGADLNSVGPVGGILNQGTIAATASGLIDVALHARADTGNAAATLGDGTLATAHLSAAATAIGLRATIGSVAGSLESTGDIDVLAHAGVVVDLSASAPAGNASAHLSSTVAVVMKATARATGLLTHIVPLGGDAANSGDVAAAAQADITIDIAARGSGVAHASLVGNDSADITITAKATARGIEAHIDTIGGDFENSGAVDAEAKALIDIGILAESTDAGATARVEAESSTVQFKATARATGLAATITTLSGGFTNSGDVGALADARMIFDITADAGGEARASLEASEIHLTVLASAYGLKLAIDTVGQGVANTGDIAADAAAVIDIGVAAAGSQASASLHSTDDDLTLKATAYAIGMAVNITTVGEGVSNSGDIDASAVAGIAVSISATAAHDAIASISADSGTLGMVASAEAIGLLVDVPSVQGVSNTGAIDARAEATVDLDVVAHSTSDNARAQITATSVIQFTAIASARGLVVSVTTLGGTLSNRGDITVTADAVIDLRLDARADDGNADALVENDSQEEIRFSAAATAVGLIATVGVADSVTNRGDIDVLAHAGIRAVLSASASDVGASAYILSTETVYMRATARATGLEAEVDIVTASVDNRGDVDARAHADIVIAISAYADSDAKAFLSADEDDIFVTAKATARGLVLGTFGQVGGDVANRGAVDAEAKALIDIGIRAESTDANASAHVQADSSTLHFKATAIVTGLSASIFTLLGGFENRGDVSAVADARILFDITAYAGGEANASLEASDIDITVVASALGMYLSIGSVDEGVTNSGDIDATAAAVIDIAVRAAGTKASASVHGTSDEITLKASASATGANIRMLTVLGDVTNSGDIAATAVASIAVSVSAYAEQAAAASISADSDNILMRASADAVGLLIDINHVGGISNTGAVDAAAQATVDLDVTAHSISDNAEARITATSTIQLTALASARGLAATVTTLDGAFANRGDITAVADAVVDVALSAYAEDGNADAVITNESSEELSFRAVATAQGLVLDIRTAGAVANRGDIDVLAHAGLRVDLSANATDGHASAYVLSTETVYMRATAQATGLRSTIITVEGDVFNSGDIDAKAHADIVIDAAAHSTEEAKAYLSADEDDLYLTAKATAYGLVLEVAPVGGDVENRGTIEVEAAALIDIGVLADSTDDNASAHVQADSSTLHVKATAAATGIWASSNTITGDFKNSGDVGAIADARVLFDITAYAGGEANASLEASDINITIVASAVGMFLTLGTVGGDLTNSGDIAAQAAAVIDIAVNATGSKASASLHATSDEITLKASADATGIRLDAAAVAGDLTNSGDIEATAVARIAVAISAYASHDASASISADSDNLRMLASAEAAGLELELNGLGGDFTNSGGVEAIAQAVIDLDVGAHSTSDDAKARITATDTIHLTALASAKGIDLVVVSSALGDVVNRGDVSAVAEAVIDVALDAVADDGNAVASITNDSNEQITFSAVATAIGVFVGMISVAGSAANRGDIDVLAHAGLQVDIAATGYDGKASAYLFSTATIYMQATAGATGLHIEATHAGADVANSGAVDAKAHADIVIDVAAHADGDATAYISAESDDIFMTARATAQGVVVLVRGIDGDLENNGAIDAEAKALIDIGLIAESTSGNATAQIEADSSTLHFKATALATGLLATVNTLAGGFSNAGDVDVLANAAVVFDITAYAGDEARASLEASEIHITASASAFGLNLRILSVGDDVTNSGDLDIAAAALIDIVIKAAGSDASASLHGTSDDVELLASAYAIGVPVNIPTIGGDVVNSGDIAALAVADIAVSISADGSVAGNASISADSDTLQMRASAEALGLLVDVPSIGNVRNSGALDVAAEATIELDVLAHADSAVAQAQITASQYVQLTASALARGLVVTVGDVNGTFSNTGDITATANAVVDADLRADSDGGKAVARITSDSADGIELSAIATAIGLVAALGTVDADVSNGGDVDVVAHAGILVAISASAPDAAASAYMVASDPVSAKATALATGLRVEAADVGGNVANSGDVAAAAFADIVMDVTAYGSGAVTAFISAETADVRMTAKATAYGLVVDVTGVDGDIVNSGAVDAAAVALIDIHLRAESTDAGATAQISADSSTLFFLATADATGLSATVTTLGGDFTNSGYVGAVADARILFDITADAGGEANASLEASEIHITALASAYGLILDFASAGADVVNSGDIDAQAVALIDIAIKAVGSDASASLRGSSDELTLKATAYAIGGLANAVNLVGDLTNSGDIEAVAVASVGVSVSARASKAADASISAASDNILIRASAEAIGLLVDVVGGSDVGNSGAVDAQASASIDLRVFAHATTGAANAEISASRSILLTALAHAVGFSVSAGGVSGTLFNDGDVAVTAAAAMDIDIRAEAVTGNAHADLTADSGDGIAITAKVTATGVLMTVVGLPADVRNSGDLFVLGAAEVVLDLTATAELGNADASIATQSDTLSITANASAYGLRIGGDSIGGAVNTGTIVAAALALLDVSLTAESDDGDAHAFVRGSEITLNANATAYGLALSVNADLLGDFENGGNIVAVADAGVVADISAYASSGAAEASISATSDSLTIRAVATAYGLYADVGVMTGDLTNSAHIESRAFATVEVALTATALDGVAKADIEVDTDDLSMTATATAYGIGLIGTTLGGAFENSGAVTAVAAATVVLALSAYAGDAAFVWVSGSQGINIAAKASAYGISIQVPDVGSVENSGGIALAAVASIEATLTAQGGEGSATAYLEADSNSISMTASATVFGIGAEITTVDGDVANSGAITGLADAEVAVHLSAYASAAQAKATISATDEVEFRVIASAAGMELDIGTVTGDVDNSGDVAMVAVGAIGVTLSAEGGEGSAIAFIASTTSYIALRASALAIGLDVDIDDLDGAFINSGGVTAVASGVASAYLSAVASGLGAVAYLKAAGATIEISAYVFATGFELEGGDVGGTVTNSGALHAIALGEADATLRATAGATGGEASAFISASSSIDIAATVSAEGIDVGLDSIGAGFTNTGGIEAVAAAGVAVSLSAYAPGDKAFAHLDGGDGIELGASARAEGIDLSVGTVTGIVTNSGDMTVRAIAQAGLTLYAEAGGGEAFAYVSNTGSAISLLAEATAYGFEASLPTLNGSFANDGDLTVDATAVVAATLTAEAKSGAANAYIAAGTRSVQLSADASAYGLFATAGSMTGSFGNSGALDVGAIALIALTMEASASGGVANAYVAAADRLTISAVASAYGAVFEASDTTAGVTNSGAVTVDAQAAVAIELRADTTGDAEAYLSSVSTLTLQAYALGFGVAVNVGSFSASGAVENSGDLDIAAVARIDLTLAADGSSAQGRAFLFGSTGVAVTASASAYGLGFSGEGVGLNNSGALEVAAGAAVVLDIHADGSTAGPAASAFINSTASSVDVHASASAFGMTVDVTTMGPVGNSGALDVGALATLEIGLDADASAAGDAVAYIYANASAYLGAEADAVGLWALGTSLGLLSNDGAINVAAWAEVDITLSAYAPAGNADAHIDASGRLSIAASASAYGVDARIVTLDGFANTGDIASSAVAKLDLAVEAADTAAVNAATSRMAAVAHAFGISLFDTTILGDATNDADVTARAFASAHVDGAGVAYTASALAVAMFVGKSGTVDGDVVNSGRLAAAASATAYGAGTPKAVATAVGLDIHMNVLGNVVNTGTVVAFATADSAYAYGVRVVGHVISGSIRNTGIIAAFADGGAVTQAFALQLKDATGPTTFEQLDGLVIGDLNLDNTTDQADTVEFSGGEILGDILGDGPAAGDELVAFAGVDDTLNLSGDIVGLRSINVNPLGAPASSIADVELRLGGNVTNTGDLNVNTHGTLVVGLVSDINVQAYTQVPTGTTLFEIAPGGQSGRITTDAATLAGTVGIRPQAGLYGDNESYFIIDGGTIDGTYDNVRSTALLHVDDDYIGDDVFLNVERVPFDAVDGLTRNQRSVGGAFETDYDDLIPGTDFADVVGSLFTLTTDQYRDALDDLAGAEHAQLLKIGAGAIQSIDNALMGRLAFVRGLSAEQMASVDGVGLAFAQVASTGDVDFQMDLAQAEAQAVAAPGDSGVWARVFGGTSTLDGDDEAPGFDADGGGVSVGIDHRISPDLIVGLFGGYAHSDASFDTNADGSVDTYQVGVYGSWASGALHVDGLVAGAWQSFELTRSVDFLGRRAQSDYDGWAATASVQVGYDIALGSAAVLQPMVGLDYIHLETDGFEEDGADSVDLNVESGTFDSLKSSVGVRLTAQFATGEGMVIVPTASLAWEHEFLDATGAFTASFDGSPNGTTFDIVGSTDEADAVVLDLGVALTSDTMTAYVGYEGKVSGDGSSHQGTIGIRFAF